MKTLFNYESCVFFVFIFIFTPSLAIAQLFAPGTPGCQGCKSNEYLLRSADTIPPNENYVHIEDPPCANAIDINEKFGLLVATAPKATEGKKAAGEIKAVASGLGVQGGTLGKIIKDYTDSNKARCHPVCATIPEGAKITGIAFYMKPWNASELTKCQIGNLCAGFARVFPHVHSKQLVCIVASNWSHDSARPVRMDVWFKSSIRPVEYR